jgi:hypothetical protein
MLFDNFIVTQAVRFFYRFIFLSQEVATHKLKCSLPHPDTGLLTEAEELKDMGYFLIKNDPQGFRNGAKVRVFSTREEIIQEFSPYYDDISIGEQVSNFWGDKARRWLIVGKKR